MQFSDLLSSCAQATIHEIKKKTILTAAQTEMQAEESANARENLRESLREKTYENPYGTTRENNTITADFLQNSLPESKICDSRQPQPRRGEFILGELPKLKLSQLLNKPIAFSDGALLPLGGLTFSLSGGRIKHLIVRIGGSAKRSSTMIAGPSITTNALIETRLLLAENSAISAGTETRETQIGDVSELYLPFASARLSAWRITPETDRPRSPKGTQRLILGKQVYSTGGTYYGRLTDALIKNGILSLLYTENAVFSAENLYAAGDALLMRPSEPYPIGQKIPKTTRTETSGDVSVRLSKQVTKTALRYFLREGRLIEFTTSLPLFQNRNT